jgi:hypothetical protein
MILVISSPSSSTTGFLTWIFLIPVDMFLDCRAFGLKVVASGAARLFVGTRRAANVNPEDDLEAMGAKAKELVEKAAVVYRGRRVREAAVARSEGALEMDGMVETGRRERSRFV